MFLRKEAHVLCLGKGMEDIMHTIADGSVAVEVQEEKLLVHVKYCTGNENKLME